MDHSSGVDEFRVLNGKLKKWCMEIRENLLSSATFEEKSSWNTVFRAENWVGSMEASLAKNPEKFCWKGSNDHCAETGDRRFPITDSQKTVTLKSTGSELKPQTDRANVNVIDGWSQKSKEYKSRAAQTECEMISVGITCQVKDLIVSSNNETSPSGNSVVSSCNKVMVAINDAETKSIDVSSPTSIPEDEMKDILTAEESDDQELEHLESYSALTQNKRSGEFTEASSHTETNKIRFSNQPNQIDLAASVENTPMESRNSILEWSRNVFRTVRSVSSRNFILFYI